MKKIISLILSVVMLLSVTAGLNITVYADELPSSGSCGDNVTYKFDSETGALTISGTGDMTEYAAVNQCPLSMNDRIVSIVIEEGVTSVGRQAFAFCDNLKSVTIPTTVTKIGAGALGVNKCLTTIIVDKNNTVFDSRNDCNAIIKTADNELMIGSNSTVIPNDITQIADYAFLGCKSLTSINIPEGVTRIGDGAFNACTALKGIHIPSSVTELGKNACFFGSNVGESSSAVTITVDKDNPIYDSRNNCNAIIETATNTLLFGCNTTVIPFTVESIGRAAFCSFKGLKNIIIPYNVKKISWSFDYTELDSATIYNPECEIYDSKFTFFEAKKIYGYENSTAQQYAQKYSIPFEAITCEHSDTVVYKENEKAATYYEKGSYDNVTYCATCGKELGRETVKTDVLTTTLTIHWSSIDGVDLEEPIVIENVKADSTVNEVLENAGYKSNSDIFTKDGYVELHLLYPKPMSEYKELGEVFDYVKLMTISSETRNTKIGENGLDIYTAEYIRLPDDTEVNIEVEAPVCGTSTTTQKSEEENDVWDFSTQTNYPRITIPENVHYYLAVDVAPENHATELQNGAWVLNETTYNQPYIGTFEGGKTYYAFTGAFVEYGYLFSNSGPKLTINGIEPTAYYAASKAVAWGIVPVTAVHTPVTDETVEPTCTTDGLTKGSHCAGCGEVFKAQEAISALGHSWDNGKVTRTPTPTAEGVKTITCTRCDLTKTEPIAKCAKYKNTLAVKGKKVSVKYSKLSKKNQSIAVKKAITLSAAQGKVTYRKASGNKKITVAKNGKITVKKGLKKGTYKVKVKVTAAGNKTYKPSAKTVTVTIYVK